MQRTTIRCRVVRRRARFRSSPHWRTSVWKAPSTSRTRVVPSGRSHSASVQRRWPWRSSRDRCRSGGAAEAAAHALHVELGAGVRARRRCRRWCGGTCRARRSGWSCSTQSTSRSGVVSRCWTAAADDAVRGPRGGLVAGEQQDGRLDPAQREARAWVAHQLERPPASEELDAVDGFEAELVVDEDSDVRSVPAVEAVHARGGQAPEHAARASVEHAEPEPLIPGELARSSYRSPVASARPTGRAATWLRTWSASMPRAFSWRRATMPAWCVDQSPELSVHGAGHARSARRPDRCPQAAQRRVGSCASRTRSGASSGTRPDRVPIAWLA